MSSGETASSHMRVKEIHTYVSLSLCGVCVSNVFVYCLCTILYIPVVHARGGAMAARPVRCACVRSAGARATPTTQCLSSRARAFLSSSRTSHACPCVSGEAEGYVYTNVPSVRSEAPRSSSATCYSLYSGPLQRHSDPCIRRLF